MTIRNRAFVTLVSPEKMEQTGEPYNVVRHAAEGQRATGDSHLIGDDETRRVAEGFLAASPWLGNIQWGEVPPSLFEEYTVIDAGTGVPGTERDVQPSWSVTFVLQPARRRSLTIAWC